MLRPLDRNRSGGVPRSGQLKYSIGLSEGSELTVAQQTYNRRQVAYIHSGGRRMTTRRDAPSNDGILRSLGMIRSDLKLGLDDLKAHVDMVAENLSDADEGLLIELNKARHDIADLSRSKQEIIGRIMTLERSVPAVMIPAAHAGAVAGAKDALKILKHPITIGSAAGAIVLAAFDLIIKAPEFLRAVFAVIAGAIGALSKVK